MSREALKDLLEKVEAGAFPADMSARDLGLKDVVEATGVPVIRMMFKAFSGSLDAAKALHEAALLGWHFNVSNEASGDGYVAEVFSRNDEAISHGHSETPARAWLIAILKALIAEQE